MQLELDQLDFSELGEVSGLNLLAVVEGDDKDVSEALRVQRCHHSGCGNWGHAREDGYCRHCGRKIKDHEYSYGFPKLEISECRVVLWNGTDGKLMKKKESRTTTGGVHSMGLYEDKDHSREYVEIMEEKYDPDLAGRFVELQQVLEELELLNKRWKPPLAVFQEEYQRTLWIYPRLPKEKGWHNNITASSYIFVRELDPLKVRDIAGIGIQLCDIAEKIHKRGYVWASLKLSDLVLSRNKQKEISIYLRSRDIAWNSFPSKDLLDTCLIPWELFWEEELRDGYEVSEVYIIAALLYFLKAKAPNLLSYNPLSYPYGLPTLKLFCRADNEDTDYFESVMNQALLLNPKERGYQSVHEFKEALQQFLQLDETRRKVCCPRFDVGQALDVGDGKRENDLTPNQDAIFVSTYSLEKNSWGIFVLCDGVSTATVGGGELASGVVIETFQNWWMSQTAEEQRIICESAHTDFTRACQYLNDVVDRANRRIRRQADKLAEPEELEDAMVMGTTVTAGIICRDSMVFAWLGDSPIYRINSFLGWERLNYDHNERNYRLKEGLALDECFIEGGNALTHCAGAHFYLENHLDMSFGRSTLYPGEQILICSDGIPDYIEQESAYAANENYQMLRMASILHEYGSDTLLDASALAGVLLSGVNRVGGGVDNLSSILIRILPEGHQAQPYQRLKALGRSMQTVMRQTNLESAWIIPPGKRKNKDTSKKNSHFNSKGRK